MSRSLGFASVVLTIIGLLIVFFTYPYGSGLTRGGGVYFYYDDINVCRVIEISCITFLETEKLSEFRRCQVEVDEIPEQGLQVLIGIEFRRRGLELHHFAASRQWVHTFFPNKTKLPLKMIIRLTGSITKQDLNLTGNEDLSIRTYQQAYVLLQGDEVEDLGSFSSQVYGHVSCPHPIVASIMNNLYGIGIGVASVGVAFGVGVVLDICLEQRKKCRSEDATE